MRQREAVRIIEQTIAEYEIRLTEYVGLGRDRAATAEVAGKLKGLKYSLGVLLSTTKEIKESEAK